MEPKGSYDFQYISFRAQFIGEWLKRRSEIDDIEGGLIQHSMTGGLQDSNFVYAPGWLQGDEHSDIAIRLKPARLIWIIYIAYCFNAAAPVV